MPIRAEVRAPHPAELLELQVPSQWILEVAQWPGTSCGPAGRKEAGMNHPSAAYGRALMKQGNKESTLDPVEPTNRHRNARRQARRILTS